MCLEEYIYKAIAKHIQHGLVMAKVLILCLLFVFVKEPRGCKMKLNRI